MSEGFVNKVAESGIITLNLEDYYPKNQLVVFDLKPFLFMELILREKDFREALKNIELDNYKDKQVTLTCSADAIIPMWAYMLVASVLQPVAEQIYYGTAEETNNYRLQKNLENIDVEPYTNQRVVVKGCGELPISQQAYITITTLLRPVAKSIMYGEPCSTVPVFKKPMQRSV